MKKIEQYLKETYPNHKFEFVVLEEQKNKYKLFIDDSFKKRIYFANDIIDNDEIDLFKLACNEYLSDLK